MNKSDSDLKKLYPSSKELRAWLRSQSDEVQFNIESEYQALIPCWLAFLRKKRFELDKYF